MKAKFLFILLVVAVIAATAGWFAARHEHHGGGGVSEGAGKVYSCSMHPQVRSSKPGKCPICGMDLAPIGAGQTSGDDGTIMLSSNVINVIHVQTQPVERGKLARTLRVAGTVDDDATRHRFVSAYIDGRIDKLFVNY